GESPRSAPQTPCLSASAVAGQIPTSAGTHFPPRPLPARRKATGRGYRGIPYAQKRPAGPPDALPLSDVCPAGSVLSETNGQRVGSFLLMLSGGLMKADAITFAVGKQ